MIEHFQIQELVGQTERHVSYKAYDKQSGRKYLLKRYLIDSGMGLGRYKCWKEEFNKVIDWAMRMEMPSLQYLAGGGFDENDDNPYAVFEWLHSVSLGELLLRKGELDVIIIMEIVESALNALAFMHQRNLVHGNLSPDTIMFTRETNKTPWFVAWCPIRSLACRHEVNRTSLDDFTAPEVAAGEHVGPAADLYSLGKIVREATRSFDEQEGLDEWVLKMTAERPEDRYPSAEEALDAFDDLDLFKFELPQFLLEKLQSSEDKQGSEG